MSVNEVKLQKDYFLVFVLHKFLQNPDSHQGCLQPTKPIAVQEDENGDFYVKRLFLQSFEGHPGVFQKTASDIATEVIVEIVLIK